MGMLQNYQLLFICVFKSAYKHLQKMILSVRVPRLVLFVFVSLIAFVDIILIFMFIFVFCILSDFLLYFFDLLFKFFLCFGCDVDWLIDLFLTCLIYYHCFFRCWRVGMLGLCFLPHNIFVSMFLGLDFHF